MSRLGATLPIPSTDSPTPTLLKSAVVVMGGQVRVPVGVGVKVAVTLPVDVGVAVGVDVKVAVILPVAVGVGVKVEVAGVPVEVGVGVQVGVNEPFVTDLLRKITIVWEAASPSTILILALPALRSLLINRSAGIV